MHIDGNQLVLSDGRRFLVESPRPQVENTRNEQRGPRRSILRIPLTSKEPNRRIETTTSKQAT